VQWTGLAAGPVIALAVYLALPESYPAADGTAVVFSQAGRSTAAIGAWMALWWMTEAIPVYATALLPLALLPLSSARTAAEAAAPYGHELIFLFMGGFILALSMQRWDLHRRIALSVLRLVGTGPRKMIGGFMLVTAVLSMWVSNTATAIMMLPIAMSVVGLIERTQLPGVSDDGDSTPTGLRTNFALALLLGIAYAASIGGLGTLIGSPPNLFLASYIESQTHYQLSFVRWMSIGLPLVAVFLPIAWLMLTRVLFPVKNEEIQGGSEFTEDEYRRLGPMSRGEWSTFLVFCCTASAWTFRPLLAGIEIAGTTPLAGLTDSGIAMLAALLLFVIPVDARRRVFVIDWQTAVKLPWGILVLFGGGLSLAAAIQANGVGEYIGASVSALSGLPTVLLVILVAALVIFLTELTSNTATTATLVPILFSLAPGLDIHPFLLMVPATLAASCAFMLPVATPPNAIIFSSGAVTIPQMTRAGVWLNLIGVILITMLTYLVVVPVLEIAL
jgi:sodium-dependent dicarboxylate transporter 2/3/5